MENESSIEIERRRENFILQLESRVIKTPLLEARKKLGLTAKEVAERIGIDCAKYLVYERMNVYPNPKAQEKICDFYNSQGIYLLGEDIFPEREKENLIPIQQVDGRLLVARDNTSEGIYQQELRKMLDNALSSLSEKEADIIKSYFALGNKPQEETLEEIGKRYSICKERVRQIMEKALIKLRHPSRSKNLREFLYED